MKNMVLRGLLGCFIGVFSVISCTFFAGCATSEASVTVRTTESVVARATEVMNSLEIKNDKELRRIETISTRLDTIKSLCKEAKRNKKHLNASEEFLEDITFHCADLHRDLDTIFTKRNISESKNTRRNRKEIDVEAMKLRHERTQRRVNRRMEMFDSVIKNLDEIIDKYEVALGKEDTNQAVNITTGSPFCNKLPAFGNEPVATSPSFSTSTKKPSISRVVIAF